MKFTIKQLVVAVTFVVILLAAYRYYQKYYAPDPDSERFLVLNAEYHASWQPCKPRPIHVSRLVDEDPLESAGGFGGDGHLDIAESLLEYSYNVFFGNPSFRVAYSLVGITNTNWSDYSLSPVVYFGEGNDASAEIESEFHSKTETLIVRIHQQFKARPDAKCLTLRFKWNGQLFQLVAEK